MRTVMKLAGFGAGLVAVFAAAVGVGRLAGPFSGPAEGDGHAVAAHGAPAGPAQMPGGLQVAQDGYRLVPDATELSSVDGRPFTFRILGPDGHPVTGYQPTHDKDLHLIVVRRDLGGFQHLHPTMAADGTWAVPLAVPGAGPYRAIADFQPAGRSQPLSLGVDLAAAGVYQPLALAPVSDVSTVDGYTVRLEGELVAGTSSKLTLRIDRDGVPVRDLEPYLAAYGHLVALRDGDLAYLHVHPETSTGPGPALTFFADVPSAGGYRLFLDFQHGGRVHTAAFTVTGHAHE